MLSITPIEGLYIGAAVDTGSDVAALTDVYPYKMQVGAGYTIDGIGQIRAQYIGAGSEDANESKIQAAFALTAVDGLLLDLGATIPLDSDVALYNAKVAVGANFAIDNIGIWGRVDTTIGDNTSVAAYLVPSFGFDFATIGCDISVNTASVNDETFVGFGAAPWISKGYSNGSVKAAVAFSKAAADGAELGWAIPVVLEYWF